jgi:hypothetical protein
MMQGTAHPADSLDDRISAARSQVQRTPEWHPEFERRLLKLIRLMDERDARLVAPPRGSQRVGAATAGKPEPTWIQRSQRAIHVTKPAGQPSN